MLIRIANYFADLVLINRSINQFLTSENRKVFHKFPEPKVEGRKEKIEQSNISQLID